MGKKLNRLLGRGLRVDKFKPTLNLAFFRLDVLKNKRNVRCSQARTDVVQLLHLGHQERALLRVEQVIKEQNMLDAYTMMESYINLLIERANLMEHEKGCPEELKEAVSTLSFASSRCGEFPELQEIRAAFQSHYGREFVARAVELRNNCGVNTKMIQKMSTAMPGLEIRTKQLKQIAADNNITLDLDEASGSSKQGGTGLSDSGDLKPDGDTIKSSSQCSVEKGESSDSFKAREKYKDVADAAQAAFEGAAYAAAAARAAVELSRMGGPHKPDGSNSPLDQKKHEDESMGKAPELEKCESQNKLGRTKSGSTSDSSEEEEEEEEENDTPSELMSPQPKQILIPSRFQAGLNGEPDVDSAPPRFNLNNGPFSVRRTRQVRGY